MSRRPSPHSSSHPCCSVDARYASNTLVAVNTSAISFKSGYLTDGAPLEDLHPMSLKLHKKVRWTCEQATLGQHCVVARSTSDRRIGVSCPGPILARLLLTLSKLKAAGMHVGTAGNGQQCKTLYYLWRPAMSSREQIRMNVINLDACAAVGGGFAPLNTRARKLAGRQHQHSTCLAHPDE